MTIKKFRKELEEDINVLIDKYEKERFIVRREDPATICDIYYSGVLSSLIAVLCLIEDILDEDIY